MDIKVTGDTENKTVGRREIRFYIVGDGATPTKDAVREALCKKLSLHPESTTIVRIAQSYGAQQGSGVAHSYATPEDMKRLEQGHIAEREDRRKKKREKREAEGAQEPKAEDKKEEKKEAKTPESKKEPEKQEK